MARHKHMVDGKTDSADEVEMFASVEIMTHAHRHKKKQYITEDVSLSSRHRSKKKKKSFAFELTVFEFYCIVLVFLFTVSSLYIQRPKGVKTTRQAWIFTTFSFPCWSAPVRH